MMSPVVSRRSVLASAACVATAMVAPTGAAKATPWFTPGDRSLGLQLYTLGAEAFTDLDATFAAVAAIGYKTVELVMFCNHLPADVRAALDRAGLKASGTEIGFQDYGTGYDLTQRLDAVIAAAHVIGLDTVVAPVFAYPARFGAPTSVADSGPFLARVAAAMTEDDWKAHADTLNRTGAILRKAGLRLGHHNHNVDFTPVAGTTGFDILVRETDPALVTIELDIGWVAAAGLDPIAILRRYPGRIGLMHLKDIMATTQPNYALRQDPAVIGRGTVDFAAIIPAARAAGVRTFLVEQEPPFTMPRIEAARESYRYLTGGERRDRAPG